MSLHCREWWVHVEHSHSESCLGHHLWHGLSCFNVSLIAVLNLIFDCIGFWMGSGHNVECIVHTVLVLDVPLKLKSLQRVDRSLVTHPHGVKVENHNFFIFSWHVMSGQKKIQASLRKYSWNSHLHPWHWCTFGLEERCRRWPQEAVWSQTWATTVVTWTVVTMCGCYWLTTATGSGTSRVWMPRIFRRRFLQISKQFILGFIVGNPDDPLRSVITTPSIKCFLQLDAMTLCCKVSHNHEIPRLE